MFLIPNTFQKTSKHYDRTTHQQFIPKLCQNGATSDPKTTNIHSKHYLKNDDEHRWNNHATLIQSEAQNRQKWNHKRI